MEKEIKFHYVVRAVLFSGGKVLVAKAIGEDNVFLPGGHIDLGEKATDALARELAEELGISVKVGKFLGAVENDWADSQVNHFEINLVFKVNNVEIDHTAAPQSKEDHLTFFWLKPDQLKVNNILPGPMEDLIVQSRSAGSAFWGSTL
jgi:8-oxo-dGTP diphosphatase